MISHSSFSPGVPSLTTISCPPARVYKTEHQTARLCRKLFDENSTPKPLSPRKRIAKALTRTYKIGMTCKSENPEEFVNTLTWKGKTYILTKMKNDNNQDIFSHTVWRAEWGDAVYIAKTYEQKSLKEQVLAAKADRECTLVAQQFLQEHSISDVRLAEVLSQPMEDGFLMMEYIQADSIEFWTWAHKDTLDARETAILQKAAEMIELMWRSQREGLVDFRPENVIVSGNQLVIVDCTGDLDSADLAQNLRSYLNHWAKDNSAAYQLLTQNLQELVSK